MRTIAFANEKGGVGKSPSVICLGYALTRKGAKVLLVDLDPQGSITKYFLGDDFEDENQHTLYHALVKGERIKPVEKTERLHFLPSYNGIQPLTNAEVELPTKFRFDFQMRLKVVIQKYQEYDYVIVDTPGSTSLFTTLALVAANIVIVPVHTIMSALQATADIMQLIKEVRDGVDDSSPLNPKLVLWGVLPTIYERNVKLHQQALQILQHRYKELVYPEPSYKTDNYNKAHALRGDVSVLDANLGAYWDRLAESVIGKEAVAYG